MFFHLIHHLGVLLQLLFLLVNLALGSLADKLLIAQHTVHTGQLLRQTLLLFLQTLNLFFQIYQLRKGHINGCVRNQRGNRVLTDTALILLNRYLARIA